MLETILCGKKLSSPLILGSGTIGERKENLIEALKYGAGAVVNRSLRIDNSGRKVFKPAYYIEKNYMLNADNQNITPWEYWVDCAKEIEQQGPFIVGLSARHPLDCKTIVAAFENNYSPSFFELNFSCSHSAKLYGRISYDSVEEALKLMKDISKTPILLKLSLDSMDIDKLKQLEKEKLVDGFVLSNTIGPGLKVDINNRRPVLESTFGGVSGAAIKPLVLASVFELRKEVKSPIVGVGGIETAEDVLEYLIVGCDAVQIYTKAHREGVKIFKDLNCDLDVLLKKMGESVSSIKGTFKEW